MIFLPITAQNSGGLAGLRKGLVEFTGGSIQQISISLATVITSILLAGILAYLVSIIYRKTHSGVSYTQSFNFTLIITAMVTAVIMLGIGSNLAMSLGLVGALSIIRFRTVLKDTKDMVYLFWSISLGLACGTGSYVLAVSSFLLIALVVIVLSRINFATAAGSDYILVITHERGANKQIADFLDKHLEWYELRSSIVAKDRKLHETTYAGGFKREADLAAITDEAADTEGMHTLQILSPGSNITI